MTATASRRWRGPLGEEIVGEELYPVVGSEGKLSASFDGLTMMEDAAFEHKSLNAELRALMVNGFLGSELPLQYRVQMEQQLLVSGASRVLFMASKWDGETLVEERHCWYLPGPGVARADRRRMGAVRQRPGRLLADGGP